MLVSNVTKRLALIRRLLIGTRKNVLFSSTYRQLDPIAHEESMSVLRSELATSLLALLNSETLKEGRWVVTHLKDLSRGEPGLWIERLLNRLLNCARKVGVASTYKG